MPVIALGFFDGVHIGHGCLLKKAREMADAMGTTASALTFDAHPTSCLTGKAVPLICSAEERSRLLRGQYGMDEVITLHFDGAVQNTPWEQFARHSLIQTFHGEGFVCGYDFRFGKGGEGTAEKLESLCRELQIPLAVIPEVKQNGITVSSTVIRRFLAEGDWEHAVELLGHPPVLSGIVEVGRRLGHTWGIPTANLAIPQELVVPAPGVYAAIAEIDGVQYRAVTNIGTHPTVGDASRPLAESWLQNFSGDLYGREIRIFLHHRIRGEKKFPSVEALVAEIRKNAAEANAFFDKTLQK